MKRIPLFTLLLFLCCGLQAGFAQKKGDDSNRKSEEHRQDDRWGRDKDDDRRGREDDDDSDDQRGEDYGSRLNEIPVSTRSRQASKKQSGRETWDEGYADPDLLADQRASELVAAYGIRDEKEQKKLHTACSKYYKAKVLLARDFPQKEHRDRKKREETLEQEFSKKLREILPQS